MTLEQFSQTIVTRLTNKHLHNTSLLRTVNLTGRTTLSNIPERLYRAGQQLAVASALELVWLFP